MPTKISAGEQLFVSIMYLAGFSTRRLSEEIGFGQRATIQTIRRAGIPKTARPRNLLQRACVQCGKPYLVSNYKRGSTKYCSKACKSKHEAEGDIKLLCKHCGKTFYRSVAEHRYRTEKQKNDSVYCSNKCYRERRPLVICICECGKTFTAHQSRLDYYSSVYCSRECYFKYGTHGTITGQSVCKNEYATFVALLRKKAKYLRWKKRCLERDDLKCVICGKNKGVTVHHIVSVASFVAKHGLNSSEIEKDSRWFDTSNGITLCRSCHKKAHTRK